MPHYHFQKYPEDSYFDAAYMVSLVKKVCMILFDCALDILIGQFNFTAS